MKCLIIEDEGRITRRIERIVRYFLGDVLTELRKADSLSIGSDYIDGNAFDLVTLDLNLNGEDGFEILKTAASESFHTIIISAHKEQALAAFEYGVLDFVPKPFTKERLEASLKRVTNQEKIVSGYTKFLGIKKRGGIQLIRVEDILFIQGAGVYTELVLENGRRELHDKSLEKLEQILPDQFKRIHKSYIVKMSEVAEILVSSGSKYMLRLRNGEVLPIGRTKYKDIKAKWFNP